MRALPPTLFLGVLLILPSVGTAATLRGQVVGPDGRPVAGARIRCQQEGPFTEGVVPVNGGRCDAGTDMEGRFEISDLLPGKLALGVGARLLEPKWLDRLTIPPADDPPPLRIELARGRLVEGRVVDGQGNPVAGADVVAVREDGLFTLFGSTDARGSYRLDGLPAGSFQIFAESQERQLRAESRLSVENARYHLDLSFPAGARVSGWVVGERGEPVSGVPLLLAPYDTSGFVFHATSAGDGAFAFDGVPNGRFLLDGKSPGLAETQTPLQVRVAGLSVSDLSWRLVPGGTIKGRILGLPPQALARCSVVAYLLVGGRRTVALPGKVDAQGRYEIVDAAPGRWLVRASTTLKDDAEVTVDLTSPNEPVVADLAVRNPELFEVDWRLGEESFDVSLTTNGLLTALKFAPPSPGNGEGRIKVETQLSPAEISQWMALARSAVEEKDGRGLAWQ